MKDAANVVSELLVTFHSESKDFPQRLCFTDVIER
jgi:hypothetical protein